VNLQDSDGRRNFESYAEEEGRQSKHISSHEMHLMQVVEKRIGWKDRGSKQCEDTRYTCAIESKSQLEGRESEAKDQGVSSRQCSLLMEDVITIHLNICIYTHQHTHPRIEK
jgi:hypothetical protein